MVVLLPLEFTKILDSGHLGSIPPARNNFGYKTVVTLQPYKKKKFNHIEQKYFFEQKFIYLNCKKIHYHLMRFFNRIRTDSNRSGVFETESESESDPTVEVFDFKNRRYAVPVAVLP